jgi:hypothetical protein
MFSVHIYERRQTITNWVGRTIIVSVGRKRPGLGLGFSPAKSSFARRAGQRRQKFARFYIIYFFMGRPILYSPHDFSQNTKQETIFSESQRNRLSQIKILSSLNEKILRRRNFLWLSRSSEDLFCYTLATDFPAVPTSFQPSSFLSPRCSIFYLSQIEHWMICYARDACFNNYPPVFCLKPPQSQETRYFILGML